MCQLFARLGHPHGEEVPRPVQVAARVGPAVAATVPQTQGRGGKEEARVAACHAGP